MGKTSGGTELGIIGAGASGMMAAIAAARNGSSVILLEKNDRAGKKILMTGNGKCNLSNRSFSITDYNSCHRELLSDILDQFQVKDTEVFFENLGLLLKDKGGYLYPLSEQASTVLDVLRFECRRLKVELHTNTEVTSIQKREGFRIRTDHGTYTFPRLILACGGMACPKSGSDGMGYRLAKQLGHSLIPPVPALVQLRCQEKFLKEISGVRCDAVISLWIDGEMHTRERGELQLTEYGISGIPVFQLSRFAAFALQQKKQVYAELDFLPDYPSADFTTYLLGKYEAFEGARHSEEFFAGILNKKLMLLAMKQAAIRADRPLAEFSRKQVLQTVGYLKNLRVTVTDTNQFQNAQVCAGGVPLHEVSNNMESRIVPGLYFAGELLDVDGRCGGYNLQWAWTSGYIAGVAASVT